MRKQKNGRILNILSINSFYSQENTTNNSLTTLAIQGMSNSLAREGSKNQIKINTLLTSPFDSYSIEKIVPVVSFLVHDSCIENGAIIEASAGFVSKLRIERGEGWFFPKNYTAEDVKEKIKEINSFGKNSDYPAAYSESLLKSMSLNYIQKPKI